MAGITANISVNDSTYGSVSPTTCSFSFEAHSTLNIRISGNTLEFAADSMFDYSIGQYHQECIVSLMNKGVLVKWQYSTNGSTWVDISNGDSFTYPTGTFYFKAILEEGAIVTQDIALVNGHNYIVTSADLVESAELNDNVLTIANTGKIDVIDLGAGNRADGPVVLLSTPDGVQYVGGGEPVIETTTVKFYAVGNNSRDSTVYIKDGSGNILYTFQYTAWSSSEYECALDIGVTYTFNTVPSSGSGWMVAYVSKNGTKSQIADVKSTFTYTIDGTEDYIEIGPGGGVPEV